jgi:hypothetical protein
MNKIIEIITKHGDSWFIITCQNGENKYDNKLDRVAGYYALNVYEGMEVNIHTFLDIESTWKRVLTPRYVLGLPRSRKDVDGDRKCLLRGRPSLNPAIDTDDTGAWLFRLNIIR